MTATPRPMSATAESFSSAGISPALPRLGEPARAACGDGHASGACRVSRAGCGISALEGAYRGAICSEGVIYIRCMKYH
jgi:hypothetical protein